jgi:hypothetical protein
MHISILTRVCAKGRDTSSGFVGDRRRGRFRDADITTYNRDVGAFLRKRCCDHPPNAPAVTGDKSDLASKLKIHGLYSS